MRVLLLEDVPTDAEITLRELHKMGISFVSKRVDERHEFEQALREFKPDLILSDFSLPASFDGLTALDIAREALPDVPFVFVSGTIGEDRAVEAMKRGATDYVLKDRLNRLVPVIRRALEEKRERAARRRAEKELEETRSRLDSIVSALPDMIWSIAPDPYRLLYLSPAFRARWGDTMLRDLERDANAWLDVIHPDDRPRAEAAWLSALGGEPMDVTYRVVWIDGAIRWINNRANAIRDASGRIARIDGIARDVTESKVQEEQIARLSRIRAVLSGINSVIVRVQDRDQLFREACRIAVEHGGFRLAWIGLIDKEKNWFRMAASQGEHGDYINLVSVPRSARPGGSEGIGTTERVVAEGRPVVCNDVEADPAITLRAQALERGIRSFAKFPLVADGAVIGVLAFYAADAGFFDHEELRLLQELAGNISFAVDHLAKAERLDYLAYYDALTGLPNRQLFQEQVAQLIHSIAPGKQRLALIMLDPERFRNINETLGMTAGDALLKQLSERLRTVVAEPDTVARISADRFAIALAPMSDAAEIARAIEQRILPALSQPFRFNDQQLHVFAKAGIAVFPVDGGDAAALLLNAEAALTKAKQSGERYLFYRPQISARVADELRIENELRKALREEQFLLFYQPRVDVQSGRICGMEALIRWRHPSRGVVPPAEFIPVLERTGMILEVGVWALRRAVLDHAAWAAAGATPPRVAVNVSQVQLRRAQFVEDVQAALGDSAAGRSIDIEITESMLMEDIPGNIAKLTALRAMGIGIALDDFGTGYSSLSWLARLPLDALKIDRAFISQMGKSPEQMAIVSTVISLARALNLKVVAEGVETEEQAHLLRLLRCDEAQGYLFYKPLPPEEIAALLR